MAQLEHIEAIEKRLWSAADTLRANSNYASNEYFLPVMGLVFLQPKAQFDTLVALPESADRAKAIIDAMESIEADYENLRGVLPKSEYQELDNAVLGQPGYCRRMLAEGAACLTMKDDEGETVEPLPDFIGALTTLRGAVAPLLKTLAKDAFHVEPLKELDDANPMFKTDVETFRKNVDEQEMTWATQKTTNGDLKTAVDRLATLAENSRDLVKQTDLLCKLACRLIETCENECDAKDSDTWANRDITRSRKGADEARALAVEQLKQVRYFWKQSHWLTERCPEAQLRDVAGLVKLVDRAEIAANDWSLTPGRYVGVAPEEEDEDFDFEDTLREIHVELEDLNAEAVQLAATIKKNFEELGI